MAILNYDEILKSTSMKFEEYHLLWMEHNYINFRSFVNFLGYNSLQQGYKWRIKVCPSNQSASWKKRVSEV